MRTDIEKKQEKIIWNLVKKGVGRALYDAIDAHEKQGLAFIPVEWLRDYADDCVMQYEMLENKK